MTIKELLQLATDKGYKSPITFVRRVWGDGELSHAEIDKYSELGELTMIQDWLRTKGINVYVVPDGYKISGNSFSTIKGQGFYSYEKTLLTGVYEGLKLVLQELNN